MSLLCQQVVVVVMDQMETSLTPLRDSSGALKGRDVMIFVVGVGNDLDQSSVKEIASKEEFYHHVTSFNKLMSVAPVLSEQICVNSEGN